MKILKIFLLSFFFTTSVFSVAFAADESTKGVMINSIMIQSSGLASAQLTDLSSAAIERGLKDAVLLSTPSFDSKSRVLTLNWNSITKTVNGTEYAQTLDSPLITKVKLQPEIEEITVGQELTIKGDLQSMLKNFDDMMKRGESKIDVEDNDKYTVEKNNEESKGFEGGSSNNDQGGSGYLSEGSLAENPETEEMNINTDEIISSTEACSLAIDWKNMTLAEQERIVKKSSETGAVTETGSCYNVGQVAPLEKDFSSECSIQINGFESYAAGFIYYGVIDGQRVNASGCKYDAADQKPLTVSLDFGSCDLSKADINLAESVFYPYAVKYSMINGTRYNLTECMPIPESVKSLPTIEEVCPLRFDLDSNTTYSRHRFDTYDPTRTTKLKDGECTDFVSYQMQKDMSETCSIRIEDNKFIRGHILFSLIDGERVNATGCVYDEVDGAPLTQIKDYKACSIDESVVVLENEWYQPAFQKYALIDGKRYDLAPCSTEESDTLPLPKHTEICEFEHDINKLTSYRMERVDIYDPADKKVLKAGDCYPIEEIPIQRDFDAGCAIQVNSTFGTYTRGYKYYSTLDGKKQLLSECEYNEGDAVAYEPFRDYSECSLSQAVVNLGNKNYLIPFVDYTLIDGERYELSGCKTAPDDVRPLPTKIEQCLQQNDLVSGISYDLERVDIYDPEGKSLMQEGDCYTVSEHEILRDFDVRSCFDLPDYISKQMALGYHNYIIRDGDKEYIEDCQVDLENKIPLMQEVGTCKATENLANLKATLNKSWYYLLEDGSKEFITDCEPSDEIYNIEDTENTCSPLMLPESNKVVIQNRKAWMDSEGQWHYVTSCAPTSQEADVKSEVCANPKYEHDFVGGTSYRRTRNYYVHNGVNVYISSCGRDPSTSFAHTKSTAGCTVSNNDANLRSQVFAKTVVVLDEGSTVIKGCEAQSQYIPYQFTGNQLQGKQTASYYLSKHETYGMSSSCSGGSAPSGGTIAQACARMTNVTNTWGKNYSFNPSSSTAAQVTSSCVAVPVTCANCSNPGYKYTITYNVKAVLDANIKDWKRSDGSTYRQYNKYNCQKQ